MDDRDAPQSADDVDLDDSDVADGDLDGTVSWGALLQETIARLGQAGNGQAAQLARWLVEEASGLSATELRRHPETLATQRGVAHLDAMVPRVVAGEPVQYVLGHWPFRHLDLLVDARVLIPRPETELVADVALTALARCIDEGVTRPSPLAQLPDGIATVVDLGSGSGALALSVAFERPDVDVWAVEMSSAAVAVLRANLAGLGRAGKRVGIAQGSWFDALPPQLAGHIDVVVTNPPYIAASEPLPSSVVDWEPSTALVPGPKGTEAIEEIFQSAPAWLAAHGVVVMEIGATQGAAVQAIATACGFDDVRVAVDLAGRDRVVIARRSQ